MLPEKEKDVARNDCYSPPACSGGGVPLQREPREIRDLPPVETLAPGDLVAVQQQADNITRKATLAQLANYINGVTPAPSDDADAPTGTITLTYPGGTSQSPNTVLGVDVSGIVDASTPITFAYQWKIRQSNGNLLDVVGAGSTDATYDPVNQGGTVAFLGNNYTVEVTATDAAGNSATFTPANWAIPETFLDPSSGLDVIYSYKQNLS